MAAYCEPKTWVIDRYARFIPPENKGKGEWKYFSSYGGKNNMKLSIVEPLKLIITSGDSIVLESIPLYGENKIPCVKAICRGDSILFFCKANDNVRRFRVKFAKMGPINDRENCQDFTRAVSAHVQVKTMESQEDENSQANSQSMLADATQLSSSVEYLPPSKSTRDDVTDSQIFSTKSIRQITDSLMKTSAFVGADESTSIAVTDKEIDSLVKSCLLDPQFPSFVGHVERALKKILSD